MTALFVALALSGAQALPVLTLEDALKAAGTDNPDLRAARAKLAQAKEVYGKVRANYLPTVTASGGYTYNNAEAVLPMPTGYWIRDVVEDQGPPPNLTGEYDLDNPPGFPTPYVLVPSALEEIAIQRHHQLGAIFELQQTILAPALFPAMEAASLAADAAEKNVEHARRELLFAVAQVYFGAVTAKEAWLVQERMLESHRAHERDAKVKVDAGVVPKLLFVRAQIERARAEQDVLRAKTTYDGAKSALAALLDREPDFDVTRPADPPLPPNIEDIDALATARSDVEAARLMVAIAEKDSSRVAWSYAPNLGFTARYQLANIKGFTGEFGTWALMLGLNWTLWDGGLREAERRESAAKVEEARASLDAAHNRAKDEIRRALLDLASARANRVKAEEQLRLARENHALVQVTFDAGTATAVEIADANSALLGAELATLAETLNAQLATLRLAKATGAFDPQ